MNIYGIELYREYKYMCIFYKHIQQPIYPTYSSNNIEYVIGFVSTEMREIERDRTGSCRIMEQLHQLWTLLRDI